MRHIPDFMSAGINPRPKRGPAPLAIVLFLGVVALFAPSLGHGLVDLDDQIYLSGNPLFTEGFSLATLRSAWAAPLHGMYVPILSLSFGLDAALLKATAQNPWGLHFTNLVLHAGNAVLVYLLLWSLCKKPICAFFFAALWAIHPQRVESVAWVSARKDVLSGLFGLLCVGAYALAWKPRNGLALRPASGPLAASIFFYALCMLTKSALAALPFGLLLMDFWPLRRMPQKMPAALRSAPRLLVEKIPYLVIAILASWVTAHAHGRLGGVVDLPMGDRLLAIPGHYAFYLAKFVFPLELSPLYSDIESSFVRIFLSLALLTALTAWAWRSRHRTPNLLFGWLFFLGLMVPTIGWVRFGVQSVADRFTYFPAVGLSVALLHLQPPGPERRGLRRLRWISALLLLLFLGGATLRLLPVWKSTPALFSRVLSIAPAHPHALELKAFYLIRTAGDFQQADDSFDRMFAAGRCTRRALSGNALCAAERHGPAAAQRLLLEGPSLAGVHAEYDRHRDLARYSLALRQYDEALKQARRALDLSAEAGSDPKYLHLLLMVAAYEKGDSSLALAHARQFPAYAGKTSLELADLLPYYLQQWMEYHRSDAYGFFQRLVLAYPDRIGLLNNLAWGLATADWSPARPADVLALAQQVCAAFPDANPGALDTLAAAQANAGDFPAAIRTLQQALDRLPGAEDPRVVPFRNLLLARRALYRQRQPYREEAFSRLMAAEFGRGLRLTDKGYQP